MENINENNSKYSEKEYFHSIDVAKFLMAIVIVIVHTNPFVTINKGVNDFTTVIMGRYAVPFFFITSGFLIFRKIYANNEKNENNQIVKKYCIRIITIYAIWTMLYLPLIIRQVDLSNISKYLLKCIVYNSYAHLWYLSAVAFAVILTYLISKKVSIYITANIAFILFLIGLMDTSYYGYVNVFGKINYILFRYEQIFVNTRNGLFLGFFFVSMGAVFAYKNVLHHPKVLMIEFFFISVFMYLFEHHSLMKMGMVRNDEVFFMLAPSVCLLFYIVVNTTLKKRPIYYWLREISTLVYLSHWYFLFIFQQLSGSWGGPLIFLLVLVASIIFSILILTLERFKYFKWLSFLH